MLLTECYWTHGAPALAVVGTHSYWYSNLNQTWTRNFFWSFLTKTKQDQEPPKSCQKFDDFVLLVHFLDTLYIDHFFIKISKLIYQYLSYGASHKTPRRMSKGVSFYFFICLERLNLSNDWSLSLSYRPLNWSKGNPDKWFTILVNRWVSSTDKSLLSITYCYQAIQQPMTFQQVVK